MTEPERPQRSYAGLATLLIVVMLAVDAMLPLLVKYVRLAVLPYYVRLIDLNGYFR